MRPSLLALLLAVSLAGCQFENRPDGGNPDHSGADDAEQDAYDASRGATPLPSRNDASAAQEALGDAGAAPAPVQTMEEMAPPPPSNGMPAPAPPPPAQ